MKSPGKRQNGPSLSKLQDPTGGNVNRSCRNSPMSLSSSLLLLIILKTVCGVSARSWISIVPTDIMQLDNHGQTTVETETDPMRATKMPSITPIMHFSEIPSLNTSTMISTLPSSAPSPIHSLHHRSVQPTSISSANPSYFPTKNPTVSQNINPTTSSRPTPPPNLITDVVWSNAPIPRDPPRSYFKYNTQKSAPFGPGYPEEAVHNTTKKRVIFKNNYWDSVRKSAEWEYWQVRYGGEKARKRKQEDQKKSFDYIHVCLISFSF